MNSVPVPSGPRSFAWAILAGCLVAAGPAGVRGEVSAPAGNAGVAVAASAALDSAPPSGAIEAVGEDLPGNGNPYRAIVARNAFRLKDPLPPPPPPTNAPPPVEPPKIDVKLAGLGEINGVRWAYLMVPDDKRQGQFLYPSLTDDPKRGDTRHGGVEVREINVKKQYVRVVNGGIEASLNFKDHGIKGTPAPAAGAKPGGVPPPPGTPGANPARPQTTIVVPAAGSANAQAAGQGQAEPVVFSRSRSRASADGAGTGGGGATGAAAGGGGNLVIPSTPSVNFPTRPVRSETSTPSTPATPSIPLDQQIETLLNQRKVYEAAGVPLPPIPGMPAPTPTPTPEQ